MPIYTLANSGCKYVSPIIRGHLGTATITPDIFATTLSTGNPIWLSGDKGAIAEVFFAGIGLQEETGFKHALQTLEQRAFYCSFNRAKEHYAEARSVPTIRVTLTRHVREVRHILACTAR